MTKLTERLTKVLEWREAVEEGNMIECRDYHEDHLCFDGISQKDFETLCAAANNWWKRIGSNLRVGDSMGEVRPGFAKKPEEQPCQESRS